MPKTKEDDLPVFESRPAAEDMVNSPKRNTSHPKGYEAIDVLEDINDPLLFTAMKYIWRVGFGAGKWDGVEDIKKAIWYLQRWVSKHEQ